MANPEHLDILKKGIDRWNQCRKDHSGLRPDLQAAPLQEEYLPGANLSGANLKGANLSKAYLGDADFSGADLNRDTPHWDSSYSSRVCLKRASLSEADPARFSYLRGVVPSVRLLLIWHLTGNVGRVTNAQERC